MSKYWSRPGLSVPPMLPIEQATLDMINRPYSGWEKVSKDIIVNCLGMNEHRILTYHPGRDYLAAVIQRHIEKGNFVFNLHDAHRLQREQEEHKTRTFVMGVERYAPGGVIVWKKTILQLLATCPEEQLIRGEFWVLDNDGNPVDDWGHQPIYDGGYPFKPDGPGSRT